MKIQIRIKSKLLRLIRSRFAFVFASVFIFSHLAIFLFFATPANAATTSAQGMTLDGRLFTSQTSDTALLDASVVINIKIFNPGKTCILYEENQTVDTTSTDGRFSIQVGSAVGDPKRASGSATSAMATVFQNYAAISGWTPAAATCSYSPAAGDARIMRIMISPSTTGTMETLSPDTTVDSVPNALVAETLQGLDRDHVLAIDSATTLSQANVANIFSSSNYPILTSLLAGTSTNYVTSTAGGANIPTVTTAPGSPAVGQIWFNSSANAYQYWNGSAVQQLGISGSGISALTVGSSLTANGAAGGTLNTSGTIDLVNSGVAASTYTKVTINSKGLVTYGTGLSENDIPTLTTAGHVLGGAITSGTIGGTTAFYSSGNVTTAGSVTGATVSSGVESTRQLQLFDPAAASTKYISFSAPTLSNTYSVIFPNTQGAAGTTLVNDGSGNLSWAASSSGSGSGASQWVSNAGNIYYSSGNVGIGTTAGAANYLTVGPGGGAQTTATAIQINNGGYDNPSADGTASNGDKIILWNDNVAHHIKNAIGSDPFGVWIQASGESPAHFSVWTGPSGGVAPLERMRIDSSGKFGIGTSGPATDLDVYGPSGPIVRVDGGNGTAAFVLANAATNSAQFGINSGNTNLDYIGNLSFRTGYNGTTKMTISSAGSVGIGSATPGAILDINGTGSQSALIVPRDNTGNRPTGVNGMLRYNTDLAKLELYGSGAWTSLSTTASGGGASQWTTNGTKISYAAGNVGIGSTSPAYALDVVNDVNASGSYRIGGYTVLSISSATTNTAVGVTNASTWSGGYNTAVGLYGLASNSTGTNNTTTGANSMASNGTGSFNSGFGTQALAYNVSGSYNTAVGSQALINTLGSSNTAVGFQAGFDVTSGINNTFVGQFPNTGVGVTSGSNNILIGNDVRPQSATASNQLNIGNLILGTNLSSGGTLSSGKISIGTTSTNAQLQVANDILAGSAMSVGYAGYADLNLQSNGTIFQNAGDPFTRIQSGGSGNPRLELRANGPSAGATDSGHEVGRIDFGGYMGTDWVTQAASIKGITESTWTSTSNPIALTFSTTSTTGMSERMRITGSGKVGIGTNNPAATLDVVGTASVGASIETTVAYASSGSGYTIPDATINIRRVSLTADALVTLPAFAAPALKVWTLTVFVKQDSSGAHALTWAAPSGNTILWDSSGAAPAPQTNANGVTIYTFTKASDDTTWYGSMVWRQN